MLPVSDTKDTQQDPDKDTDNAATDNNTDVDINIEIAKPATDGNEVNTDGTTKQETTVETGKTKQ